MLMQLMQTNRKAGYVRIVTVRSKALYTVMSAEIKNLICKTAVKIKKLRGHHNEDLKG
jgi:uncharacterized protein YbjQ (UPF0145 family)